MFFRIAVNLLQCTFPIPDIVGKAGEREQATLPISAGPVTVVTQKNGSISLYTSYISERHGAGLQTNIHCTGSCIVVPDKMLLVALAS